MPKKMTMDAMTKYFIDAALASLNSSFLNPERKKGSAARRYICVKRVMTTAIFTIAPYTPNSAIA